MATGTKLAMAPFGRADVKEPSTLAFARHQNHSMRLLEWSLDPISMMEAYGKTQPGWEGLDDWQAEYLETEEDCLLNCTRQAGKSTTASGKAIHRLIRKDGALVIVASPKLDQSKELYRKCLRVYKALDKPIPIVHLTTLWMELANGSRIICVPDREDTIRGFSGVDFMLYDESSRISDATYLATTPMLAVSGGAKDALSTPKGKRGWWYTEWAEGEGWKRFEVPASMIKRIPKDFLAKERRRLGEDWFMQEYFCQFREVTGGIFRQADIEAMFDDNSVQPIFPDLLQAMQRQSMLDLEGAYNSGLLDQPDSYNIDASELGAIRSMHNLTSAGKTSKRPVRYKLR